MTGCIRSMNLPKPRRSWDRITEKVSGFWKKTDPVINEELRKTIELCIQNDIQIRIVLPPKAPNILYNQSYLDEINGYYETLMNDYPGITCDIHPDMGLVMENYADYVHFNNSGAKIVTNYVKERYPEDF